jgi:hypothetical protein
VAGRPHFRKTVGRVAVLVRIQISPEQHQCTTVLDRFRFLGIDSKAFTSNAGTSSLRTAVFSVQNPC